MADSSEYVDGTSIKWTKLAQAITGTVLVSIALGVSNVLNSIYTGAVNIIGAVGGFLSDVTLEIGSIPIQGVAAAWTSATATVPKLGIFAAPLGLALAFGALIIRRDL